MIFNNGRTKNPSWIRKTVVLIFGFFLSLVVLEVALRLEGFTILAVQKYKNQQSIKQKGSYRIMCLGESTTQNQYPTFLEKILNQNNPNIKFSVIDKGLAGANTTTLLETLEANLDVFHPDMLVAMMGCNDERVLYYQNIPDAKSWLFGHVKVYKLLRILWAHSSENIMREGTREGNKTTPVSEKKNRMEEARFFAQKKDFLEKGSASQQTPQEPLQNPTPEIDFQYREVGYFYSDKENFSELEQLAKKAIQLSPKNSRLYVHLGLLYKDHLWFSNAEETFRKAIEVDPKNDEAFAQLGRFYVGQKKFAEGELALKKALDIDPNMSYALNELGLFYGGQGRFREAVELFKRAVRIEPKNERFYGRLALLYSQMGDRELFEIYSKKANILSNENYDSVAVINYHKLKEILDKNKIRLVCVQYPMRSIQPLKDIFQDDKGNNIVFVDNESVFKNVVAKEGYQEYFKDMFGGNFGHCTDKGNELLAKNIAAVILKEVFDKG